MLIHRLRSFIPLYPVLGLLGACTHAFTFPVCNSSIFCDGELLRKVQLAGVFNDSKTFVDLQLLYTENATLTDFVKLLNKTDQQPTLLQLREFVDGHFKEGGELEPWMPTDFYRSSESPLLQRIIDPNLRQFAESVIQIWGKLGRKVSKQVSDYPDRFSFLYVPNGFIIPGGRFKELYYWDTYWIVRGLLISNMPDTARGVIENLLYLVETYGYIPNGSRLYYLGRSQPPLLAAMVATYFEFTQDLKWLRRNVGTVEKELRYWLETKQENVFVKGQTYTLLRYYADRQDSGPRPESYREDYNNAASLPPSAREDFYHEMKSTAETGWDFSSRWFIKASNASGQLTDVHTTKIIPVDLNAIFAGALQLTGEMYNRLKDGQKAHMWLSYAYNWRKAIENVLWDDTEGSWFDYDMNAQTVKKHFYPSCAAPLWAGAVENNDAAKFGARLVQYLLSSDALNFPGGVPTSMCYSKQQWDFPNAWSPLQSILIGGLELSGNKEAKILAREQALSWVRSNYMGYCETQMMFEKYCALDPGKEGSGGEYSVQDGFGWTNGVVLELLQRYGDSLNVEPCERPSSPVSNYSMDPCTPTLAPAPGGWNSVHSLQ